MFQFRNKNPQRNGKSCTPQRTSPKGSLVPCGAEPLVRAAKTQEGKWRYPPYHNLDRLRRWICEAHIFRELQHIFGMSEELWPNLQQAWHLPEIRMINICLRLLPRVQRRHTRPADDLGHPVCTRFPITSLSRSVNIIQHGPHATINIVAAQNKNSLIPTVLGLLVIVIQNVYSLDYIYLAKRATFLSWHPS